MRYLESHSLLALIRQELQFRKYWVYKLSWIIAFAYFLILQGDPGTEVAIQSSIAMLVSLIGMLGLNSIQFTLSSEKARVFESRKGRIIVTIPYTVLMLIPWFFLPLDFVNGGLLLVECAILFSASYSGFGNKSESISSKLFTLLPTRILPLIIVLWTFYLVGNRTYDDILLLVGLSILWQGIVGIRSDFNKAQESLKIPLLIAEVISFSCLSILLIAKVHYVWIILGISVIGIISTFFFEKWPRKMQLVITKSLDSFYFDWLSYFFLIGTIFIKTEITTVFAIHLIFFQNGLKTFILNFINWLNNSKLKRALFNFTDYRRGLIMHLCVLIGYTIIACIVYKMVLFYVPNEADFFEKQKLLSKLLVIAILFHGLLIILLNKKIVLQTLKKFILETGSPYNLSIFRIIFFLIILGSFYGEVFQEFEHWTHLPDSERADLPLIGWLIEIIPINPELYRMMSFIGVGLAISILFGFKTRWALILYVPIALYLWGVPNFYGKLNHRHIMVWIPIILTFSRCADVLSVDAMITRYRKKTPNLQDSVEYALPFKMFWITLGIIYCSSGFHKLWDTGLFWALSDNLKNQIQLEWIEQYDTIKSFRIDRFPTLLNIGGIGIILMEIIYPILILKSYTRIFAFIGAWGLHLSAGYFLFIDFFHLRIANLSLINWRKGKNLIREKMTGVILTNQPKVPFDLKNLNRMPIVYVGGGLIVVNLLFSILQINSWPFSGYPSYSSVVADEVTLLEMHATDVNGKLVDVKMIGKNAGFRWESIRPFEERINELAESSDTTGLQAKLESYWSLWSIKVDSLDDIVLVKMSLVRTSSTPEKRHIILSSKPIGTVFIQEKVN